MLEREEGRHGNNDVTDGPNGLSEGVGGRRKRESELKTAAKSRIQRVLKTASNCCNPLSFQSEEVEKDCVRRIAPGGRNERGAIGRWHPELPKETVLREVEGGSEVEWEIRVGVPMVL